MEKYFQGLSWCQKGVDRAVPDLSLKFGIPYMGSAWLEENEINLIIEGGGKQTRPPNTLLSSSKNFSLLDQIIK
jgi:hypothetical protein